MSDASVQKPRGFRSEIVLIAVVALLVLGALFYVNSQRKQVLRSSPAGMDGLHIWLNTEGVETQSFSGGWPLNADTLGLMIIPLYDSDIEEDRVAPTTKEELLLQQDEFDHYSDVLIDKASEVPSLIVLPKWRTGMRLTGLGHPFLLVEAQRVQQVLSDLIDDPGARPLYGRTAFTDFQAPKGAGVARLYAAQMFVAPDCTPVIGRAEAMLLARCPLPQNPETSVLVLSDPDLLNNHGLRLGDNARIVRDLIAEEADEKTVLIDYSPYSWLRSADEGIQRDRTWADLLRFFDPPFLALWVGVALTLALALWRAARRFGPVIVERMKIEASKAYAMRARARLMRLSDQDGALMSEYAKARIAAVAAQMVGPGEARRYGQRDAFLAFVKRRNPERARQLGAVLEAIDAMPDRIAASEAITHVTAIEQVLEHITHDT